MQASFFGSDFYLMPFFVVPGILALIAGFTASGIAVLRTGVLPRWTGASLVGATLLMLGFNY